mgnify:CR=1 FL=1
MNVAWSCIGQSKELVLTPWTEVNLKHFFKIELIQRGNSDKIEMLISLELENYQAF